MKESKRIPEQELKIIIRRYDKICEKLEQLNEEAFQCEQDMMYLSNEIKKGGRKDES